MVKCSSLTLAGCLPTDLIFVLTLSKKHEINLMWPNTYYEQVRRSFSALRVLLIYGHALLLLLHIYPDLCVVGNTFIQLTIFTINF